MRHSHSLNVFHRLKMILKHLQFLLIMFPGDWCGMCSWCYWRHHTRIIARLSSLPLRSAVGLSWPPRSRWQGFTDRWWCSFIVVVVVSCAAHTSDACIKYRYPQEGKMRYLHQPKMIVVNKRTATNKLMEIGMVSGSSVVAQAYVIPVYYIIQDLLQLSWGDDVEVGSVVLCYSTAQQVLIAAKSNVIYGIVFDRCVRVATQELVVGSLVCKLPGIEFLYCWTFTHAHDVGSIALIKPDIDSTVVCSFFFDERGYRTLRRLLLLCLCSLFTRWRC